MENNTTTLRAALANAEVGTLLSRETFSGAVEFAYYTGSTAAPFGQDEAALLYNTATGGVVWASLDGGTSWKVSDTQDDSDVLTPFVVSLLKTAGEVTRQRVTSDRNAALVGKQADTFKASTRELLIEWFDENLDEGSHGEAFDELLEDLGLEARSRAYTVRVRISYEVDVEVEATSEEAAGQAVEDDSYLATAEVDTSYYEDYEVISVEEA